MVFLTTKLSVTLLKNVLFCCDNTISMRLPALVSFKELRNLQAAFSYKTVTFNDDSERRFWCYIY